ncbi:MAG: tRNA-dihydrouridine synthase family protein [Treponema sp.]|jgi:tRNA-dihydrouridine synthase|nr:tRNA-dihydrouridine synthase family protein [Treponema sp.]
MAEISHRALRELIAGFDSGAGGSVEYFTEMISAGALLGGGPFEKWYLDAGPCPDRLVYQLVGSDPGQLERAAALLDGRDCLGIDLNMGCAAPAIRRIGAGIAWMGDIDKAAALAGRVRKALRRRRFSVKLRLGGPGDREGDFEYLVRFCRALEARGVELITLHPRLAGEKFKRPARWDYVEALRRELGIPVAGNGDIDDAAELLRRAGGGKAMVGRGAVRRPWIFAEARLAAGGTEGALAGGGEESPAGAAAAGGLAGGPNLEETGLRFLELLAQYQPPEFHLSRARRFFNYFCDNLKWGTYVKNLLNREESLGGIAKAWAAYFNGHPEEQRPYSFTLPKLRPTTK